MTLDPNTEADSVDSANEDLDSVNLDSGSDSQDIDTQDSSGESDDSAPDTSAQQDTSDGSSTNPDTTSQAAERNWQAELEAANKRIADLRSGHSRIATQFDQYKKQYEGIDPNTVRAYQTHQEQVKKDQMKVWNAQHPDNAAFQGTLTRWKMYREAMGRASTPEEKQAIDRTLGAGFTQRDAENIKAWESYQQQYQERMAMDPQGALAEMIRQEAEQLFAAKQQEYQAQYEVSTWFEAPANQPIVEKYRDEMIQKLKQDWPWQAVREYIEAKYKTDSLQSRVGTAEKTSAQARAQQQALKSSATVHRDPATKKANPNQVHKEAIAWAKKKGLPMMHPKVMQFISDRTAELNQQ